MRNSFLPRKDMVNSHLFRFRRKKIFYVRAVCHRISQQKCWLWGIYLRAIVKFQFGSKKNRTLFTEFVDERVRSFSRFFMMIIFFSSPESHPAIKMRNQSNRYEKKNSSHTHTHVIILQRSKLTDFQFYDDCNEWNKRKKRFIYNKFPLAKSVFSCFPSPLSLPPCCTLYSLNFSNSQCILHASCHRFLLWFCTTVPIKLNHKFH